MNLNNAFQNLVGEKSRRLFVCSDVGLSEVVGNQVTDLLREINCHCEARKDVVDTIVTQRVETTGELCNLSEERPFLPSIIFQENMKGGSLGDFDPIPVLFHSRFQSAWPVV